MVLFGPTHFSKAAPPILSSYTICKYKNKPIINI
jgi:hypothetical protein